MELGLSVGRSQPELSQEQQREQELQMELAKNQ